MKTRSLPTLVALALVPGLAQSQSAPPAINYQGRLTQSTGVVVPDGLTAMRVRIFATASGGTALWDSGDLSVVTKSGTFSILLGSGGMPPMSPVVFALGTVYIEVQPAGQAPLLPRQPIASVPWALYAQTVSDGAITTLKLANDAVTSDKIAFPLVRTVNTGAGGLGLSINNTSEGAGIRGRSSSYIGVIGASGSGSYSYGVWGQNEASENIGILGAPGYGVQGIEHSTGNFGQLGTGGAGVFGNGYVDHPGVEGTSQTGAGLKGTSASGPGVYGRSISTGNLGTLGAVGAGVFGSADGPDGRAVYGKALAATGTSYGVFGESGSAIGIGVYGIATAQSSQTHGVYGDAYGKGVAGNSNGATGYGVFATNDVGGTGLYARGTSPGYAGFFQGDVRTNGSSAVFGNFDAHGNFNTDDSTPTKPGPGDTWTTISDARLKKNISPLENSLSKLLGLRGVSYEYRDPKRGAGRYPGFIAQDVQKVFPDWVTVGDDGYLRVRPIGFEASAVEALRELEARITRAQRENTELKLESSKLRSRVGELAALNEALTARVTRMERLLTQLSSVAPTRKNVK